MPNTDQIRPLTDVPDHGYGLLGGLTHSVLAEYNGIALPAPCLHLGQNTLPNPPFPMASQVPFGDLTQGWLECDEDLTKFLETGARALRTQPTPEISAYSQQVRILQQVLRFDAIAMVLAEQMIWPADADGVARWSLAADVLARRRDGQESAVARPTLVGCAVDRTGNALLGWLPADDAGAGIEIIGAGVTTDDKIVALLRDVLLAQYAWTSAVFGEVPLPLPASLKYHPAPKTMASWARRDCCAAGYSGGVPPERRAVMTNAVMTNAGTTDMIPVTIVGVAAAGSAVVSVRVTRVADETFYAQVELSDGVTIDARPSDAINLASAAGAPAFVASELLDLPTDPRLPSP